MDNLNDEEKVTAEPAEAERKEEAAQNLGKFKSVQALLNAYESLEVEFTRRSQRLKELENAKNPIEPTAEAANGGQDSQSVITTKEDGEIRATELPQEIKDKIIGDYLKSVKDAGGVPLIVGGSAVPSQRTKVNSVAEAGKLAKEFIFKSK